MKTLFAYGFCMLCMFGIIGKTNPPNSSVRGFGHGFIRAPFVLGDVGFMVAIPFLSIFPTTLVAVPFRFIYRGLNQTKSKTLVNFSMLLLAAIVAIINASLYRGD